jgi:hypothetical protein
MRRVERVLVRMAARRFGMRQLHAQYLVVSWHINLVIATGDQMGESAG